MPRHVVDSEDATGGSLFTGVSPLVLLQIFFGGGWGRYGSQKPRTDEEIENDERLKVPKGRFCHTIETIPQDNSFYRDRDDFFSWSGRLEIPKRLLDVAREHEKKLEEMRGTKSFIHDDYEDSESSQGQEVSLEEAINIRRSLLQLVHPLNSSVRRVGLALLQNLAATFVHFVLQASTAVDERIVKSGDEGAINEWRLMSRVFRRLVGMRLKEGLADIPSFRAYAIVNPAAKAAMGTITNSIEQAKLNVLPVISGIQRVERSEEEFQWFNRFQLPTKLPMTSKDWMNRIDQALSDGFMDKLNSKTARRMKRHVEDMRNFIKLYDNQYLDAERQKHLKAFLNGDVDKLEKAEDFEKTSEPTNYAKIVGEDKDIPAEFAERFDDPTHQIPTCVDAFDYWFKFIKDSGTYGWLTRLHDPTLRIVELYKLEKGTLITVAAFSAMMEVITQPEKYSDLFSSAKAGQVPKWERPQSCFHFFCDKTLAEFCRILRSRPILVRWLDKIPYIYDLDMSALRSAVANPQWSRSRKYLWSRMRSLPVHLKLHPMSIHNVWDPVKNEVTKYPTTDVDL